MKWQVCLSCSHTLYNVAAVAANENLKTSTDDAILHRLTKVILCPTLVEVILHSCRKITSSININLRN